MPVTPRRSSSTETEIARNRGAFARTFVGLVGVSGETRGTREGIHARAWLRPRRLQSTRRTHDATQLYTEYVPPPKSDKRGDWPSPEITGYQPHLLTHGISVITDITATCTWHFDTTLEEDVVVKEVRGIRRLMDLRVADPSPSPSEAFGHSESDISRTNYAQSASPYWRLLPSQFVRVRLDR